MPLTPAVSELARRTMRVAFEELEQTVTPADLRILQTTTTLEQTRAAALDIEKQLAARQALRNMRRLEPLLSGLEHYSRVVETLCNGTPFLAWIWAPITLILRVASEYIEGFQQIMKGYSKIADHLRRFELLSHIFTTEATFQQTLAVFYADILHFHVHAYKFVRRNGWKLLFLTSWGRFQRRFHNILEDLDRHGQLVDKEANTLNIAAVAQLRQENIEWREKSLDQIARDEKIQAENEYRSILSWLKIDETEQTQIIEAISDEGKRFPGTSSWLLQDKKIKSFLQKRPEQPILWLQGNPGCGKSVIAARLVDFLQLTEPPVIRHFCTYTFPSSTRYDVVLKSILHQLLLSSDELVAHVYQECIVGKKQAGTSYLERLIQTLITALSDTPREPLCMWVVIDGINECLDPTKQGRLISLMNQISSISAASHGVICKVLLTTRPMPNITKYLKKKQVIYLSDEKSPLHAAVRTYVARRLESLHDRLRQLELESHEIEEIGDLISKKAGGMFLYARLVLDYLNANLFYDGDELRAAIDQLPDSLSEFYHKLLSQILSRLNDQSQERVRCIFGWIAFAKRPLKKLELLSALSFTSGDHNPKRLVPKYIVEDICSPLIEERRDGSLTFIHVSVKHFLQAPSSAVMLREEETLSEHGIAAVSCLLSGIQILTNPANEQTKQLRFIKGIHGFHVYATEHWTQYLLANAVMKGGLTEGLSKAATSLAGALDKLDSTRGSEPASSKTTVDSKDDRLKLLEGCGTLRMHVERSLFARSLRRFETELQTSIEPKDNVPKTFDHRDGISTALDLYQSTVETLLGQDSCPGASAAELEQFKSQFRTSAYTCRLRSCPRATIGFKTHQLRHEHEVSHAGGFRCSFAGCQYPPYRTQKSLSAHIQLVHLPATKEPRRTVRRVGNLQLKQKSTAVKRTRSSTSASTRERAGKRLAGPLGATTTELEDVTSDSDTDKKPHTGHHPSNEARIAVADFASDVTLGSWIGMDHLDIVLNHVTGGLSIEPTLYERVKASCSHNVDAMWSLSEVADSLLEGFTNALTPEAIISRIWSKQPELAHELNQVTRWAAAGPDEYSRRCSCGGKDTDNMMACYNATCPNGWFHPSCVNQVMTPIQNEKWFCSSACEKAEGERDSEDEERSDSDNY